MKFELAPQRESAEYTATCPSCKANDYYIRHGKHHCNKCSASWKDQGPKSKKSEESVSAPMVAPAAYENCK